MRSTGIRVLVTGVAAVAIGIYAQRGFSADVKQAKNAGKHEAKNDPVNVAVAKGVSWLVSVQGKDGGWGQDGGETSYIRQGERLESKGNDVANTAVAAAALLHTGNTPTSGEYREPLRRAVSFILDRVEKSPDEGLAISDVTGTQIQRKLGPYIDTFLTSKLLAELDGNMGSPEANARVRRSLQKCIAKIEKNQLKDGSWNISGGWAPILGTSLASRSLFMAQQKGVQVSDGAMLRVEEYTHRASAAAPAPAAVLPGVAGGAGGGFAGGGVAGRPGTSAETVSVMAASAGVSLYQRAQELEQLTRTEKDRAKNNAKIKAITGQLSDAQFVNGFGSFGGEEFFSYLNISDSLHRSGGPEWDTWNRDIKAKMLKLQNEDGTWAGHHCITGRVAVTGAAILTMLADRDPIAVSAITNKRN